MQWKGNKEKNYDYIGFIDGDLGLTSVEAEKLINPVISDEVDFTIAKFPERSLETDVKGGFGLVKALAKKGCIFTLKGKSTLLFLVKSL